jgi:hypothetical protein
VAHDLALPIDVSKTPQGTCTALLGALRGIGRTEWEALADLGRLLTALAEHHGDEAAFAIDDDGDYLVAVPDGMGGSVEYNVCADHAGITGASAKPPAEFLRRLSRYRVIPTC